MMAALFKRRWLTDLLAVVALVTGVALVTLQLPHNPLAALVGGGASFVVVAWSFRLHQVNRADNDWDEARAQLDAGRTVVLWKPGCGHCARLRRELLHDARILWVNVYRDVQADRMVRSVNDGDLLTPTVLVPTTFVDGSGAGARDRSGADGDSVDVLRAPSADALRAELARTGG